MIKTKAKAYPEPTVGESFLHVKDQVVPDQSMSLQEILLRFTRNEALPIGKDVQYHDSDDDLEKLSNADLVDKAEYVEKMEDVKRSYDKQEKKRQKKAADDAREEAIKREAEKLKNEVPKENLGNAK